MSCCTMVTVEPVGNNCIEMSSWCSLRFFLKARLIQEDEELININVDNYINV